MTPLGRPWYPGPGPDIQGREDAAEAQKEQMFDRTITSGLMNEDRSSSDFQVNT